MRLPDFLVIGAQKAGSTWVYDCLKKHPDVFMPDAVELLYFNKLNYADEKLRHAYESNFAGADKFKRVGEKTPGYFWTTDRARSLTQPPESHNPNIPQAVTDILGDDVDLIVSLRHPVWRAVSAFAHHVKRGRIPKNSTLRDAAPRLGILDIGFYGAHLDHWAQRKGFNRIEVLIFEDDIIRDPRNGFRKICRFLKIDDSVELDIFNKASNPGVGRKIDSSGISVKGHPTLILADDIEFLIDAYAQDMDRLNSLLGQKFSTWDEETERLLEWCNDNRRFAKKSPPTKPADGQEMVTSNDRRKELIEYGVETSQRSFNILSSRFEAEPPVRLSDMAMHGDCSMGAFSYSVAGDAYSTKIGRYCSIARGVNIGQFNHTMDWLSTSPFQYQQSFKLNSGDHFPYKEKYENTLPDPELSRRAIRELRRVTTVGNDVWIGNGVKIVAGVTIGDGSVIGANAVVTKDVEPYAIVGGVPAKLIRYRFDKALRERFLRVKWWQYAVWQLEGVPFHDPVKALDEIERRVTEERMEPYRVRKVRLSENGLVSRCL